MHAEAHTAFYNLVKSQFADSSRLEVLKTCFKNYRDNRGLCLHYSAYSMCVKHKLYHFHKIPLTAKFDSRHKSMLDQHTKSPYCITRLFAYISDEDIVFDLTISGDDFDTYIELHR